jgi:hypothetical protein
MIIFFLSSITFNVKKIKRTQDLCISDIHKFISLTIILYLLQNTKEKLSLLLLILAINTLLQKIRRKKQQQHRTNTNILFQSKLQKKKKKIDILNSS